MKLIKVKSLFIICVILLTKQVNAQSPIGDYLSHFDLTWNKIPKSWDEGAFTGNGNTGTMIWGDVSGGIRFDIGNSQVYSARSRVPMGKFILYPIGGIQDFKMDLSLIEAKATSVITTEKGVITFETFTERNTDLQRIKYTLEGSEKVNLSLTSLPPVDSGTLFKQFGKELKKSPDFTALDVYAKILKAYPLEKFIKKTGTEDTIQYQQVNISKQVGYVLVWEHTTQKKGGEIKYATYYFRDGDEGVIAKSLNKFKRSVSWDNALLQHEKWWSNYYSSALISIPDKRVEANYWIQYYKIGSALKKDGMPLDLLGPWFRATPWPRIWANLNVQITYPIMNQLGTYDQANTLFKYIDDNNQHFIDAVPEQYRDNGASMGRGFDIYTGSKFSSEYGNFLWLLFNYSDFLNHFPDEKRKQEQFYPLLKRGVNFVIQNLEKDENGVYHFPLDVSPEYFQLDAQNKKNFKFKDINYNIGLLKWALKETLNSAKSNSDSCEELKIYQEVYDNLVPNQIDKEQGLMVAKDVKMELMHRHFSHLIAYYPLGIINVDNPEEFQLIEKSVNQWLTRPKFGWGYKGYTYTASCAMHARMGNGDKALEEINRYLEKFCSPNTFYLETGPVIETAMHSASATLEMLVQSYAKSSKSDEIRVYTGLPQSWENASFYKLNTQGGHKVSGLLENSVLKGIEINVSNTTLLKIVLPKTIQQEYTSTNNAKLHWKQQGEFVVLEGNVIKGDVICIATNGESITFEPTNNNQYHFGLN